MMDYIQFIVYFIILFCCVKPLGWLMAQIYENKPCFINRYGQGVEHYIYRCLAIEPGQSMDWKQYATAVLCFNGLGIILLYVLQRVQYYLALNPEGFTGVAPALAFNTAISFATNTDWQAYAGEFTMSYLTQMLGLEVKNFLYAATGMSVLIAFIRGLRNEQISNPTNTSHSTDTIHTSTIGNFWVDCTRSILYILLPLSLILAIILISQGVIQNFKAYEQVIQSNNLVQSIPMGPVASHVAITQLATDGGGFFSASAAHPFATPNPLSNFLEMLAIVLIPAAFCYTYGCMIKDKRQGWAILFVMFLILLPCAMACVFFEQQGNPVVTHLYKNELGLEQWGTLGNLEGKELRLGVVNSALWATLTSATSNGSLNALLDAYTPLGALIPLWLMHLGEVIFGGVGSGLYTLCMFVLITIFVAGLMVGRTPEYLGKKIEPFEMKMACIAVLVMPSCVLLSTAVGMLGTINNTLSIQPHKLTQILYAFTSMANNNGSAMQGLAVDTTFYNVLGGITMLLGRYIPLIAVLAIAGSMAEKKTNIKSIGTLKTHSMLFAILLTVVILILGALSFFPVLALGPIAEHLLLWRQYGF